MIQVLEASMPARPLGMNKQQSGGHCKGRYPNIVYIRVRSQQHSIIRTLNKAGKLLNTDVTTEEFDVMKKLLFIFVNKRFAIFSQWQKNIA